MPGATKSSKPAKKTPKAASKTAKAATNATARGAGPAGACFLIKSEPYKYSFDRLVADGRATWDGVRNFEARNHLRAMKTGDLCLYYHSNEGKAVVGIARVAREAYRDPTSDPDEDWSAVDVEPVEPLARPVGLDELRAHPLLSKMTMLRRTRLSVVPVTRDEFRAVLDLAKKRP